MKNSTRFPHLLNNPVLRGLPEDFRHRFLNESAVRAYDDLTRVLVQGGAVDGMFLIAHGSVEITSVNADGQSVMIHLARQGETFGEVEAISENPCVATCTAAPGTFVLFCPKPLLDESLGSVAFVRNLSQIFHDRLVRDNRTKFVDQFYTVDQRLCAYLEILSVDKPVINKTQADLAGLLGCARQTLNRELGRLRDRNIIKIEKGRIRVIDRAALMRSAAGDGAQHD